MPIRTPISSSFAFAPLHLVVVVIAVTAAASSAACLDWGAFGGPGGDGGRPGGAGEGEGEGDEGEGEGGEGEGEGLDGPRWLVIDAPITAQAELAAVTTTQLSSSRSRLFAVGVTHVFELIDDALVPVAELAVPCAGAQLFGPVAVTAEGDVLVGTQNGAVRFHDDGSCDAEYFVGSVPSGSHAVASFHDGALVFSGLGLTLFDEQGVVVDDHAFAEQTQAAFFKDAAGDGAESVILVRGSAGRPGQALRITMPATELVVEVIGDSVDAMAGAHPVNTFLDTSPGAPFLDVVDVTDPAAPVTREVRVADEDAIAAVATDDGGEVAVVGPSALVAHVALEASAPGLTSVSGARYGAIGRVVVGAGGEVWGVGYSVLLFWTPASALAGKGPDFVKEDVDVDAAGPLVAVGPSLFFADNSYVIHRADAAGDGSSVDVAQIIDSVTFEPVTTIDYRSRFAFLPAGDNAAAEPARLVEAASYTVVAYELSDDLGAVTSKLQQPSGFPFSSVQAIAILDDASKAVYAADFGQIFTSNVDLPVGQQPAATCETSGRSSGLSSVGAITVIDPSAGVDDETYVLSGQGVVSIMEPGEAGRTFAANIDASTRALLINDCIMTFSAGAGFSAVDQAQPLSPSERRGFNVYDTAPVGDRILLVGDGGGAGQLGTVPLPASSTCNDEDGAPVLEGMAMLGGEVRSQTSLSAAAFVDGELYVLDVDGLLWHVPTP